MNNQALFAPFLWSTNLAAGMKGEVNRAEAHMSVGGLGCGAIPL